MGFRAATACREFIEQVMERSFFYRLAPAPVAGVVISSAVEKSGEAVLSEVEGSKNLIGFADSSFCLLHSYFHHEETRIGTKILDTD